MPHFSDFRLAPSPSRRASIHPRARTVLGARKEVLASSHNSKIIEIQRVLLPIYNAIKATVAAVGVLRLGYVLNNNAAGRTLHRDLIRFIAAHIGPHFVYRNALVPRPPCFDVCNHVG